MWNHITNWRALNISIHFGTITKLIITGQIFCIFQYFKFFWCEHLWIKAITNSFHVKTIKWDEFIKIQVYGFRKWLMIFRMLEWQLTKHQIQVAFLFHACSYRHISYMFISSLLLNFFLKRKRLLTSLITFWNVLDSWNFVSSDSTSSKFSCCSTNAAHSLYGWNIKNNNKKHFISGSLIVCEQVMPNVQWIIYRCI